MHTFLDAKIMAKALRAALADRRIDISHSDSLECVARQFGVADWNILAARIEAARAAEPPLPEGWSRFHGNGKGAGDRVHRLGLAPEQPGVLCIEALAGPQVVGENFATLMQAVGADAYRGTRLRLSAELKGAAAGRAALWLRVDDRRGTPLAFDNMLHRSGDGAPSGSFEWTGRSIVLDVPEAAASIHFGAMLVGAGRLWARNFRLDEAGPAEAPTDGRSYPRAPVNLGLGGAAA